MKQLFAVLFITASLNCVAQTTVAYASEISLRSDNDNYLLDLKDGYYTNGLFIQYNYVAKNTSKRKINSIEIGQQAFTSRNFKMNALGQYDRPFAGYLFGRFQQTTFSKKDDVLQIGIEAGAIGKVSAAEQVQSQYHKLISIYKTTGWEYQVRSEVGLNVMLKWSPAVSLSKNKSEKFSIKPVAEAMLGTTFTNASVGTIFQFGLFEKNAFSSLWNATVSRDNSNRKGTHELFFYFHPQFTIHAYNATVQGGLFRHDKGEFISDIYHTMYRHRIGFVYADARITTTLEADYLTKEAKTQQVQQRYASLRFAYRFN
jgi:lipid A 3-O-deacylase